MKYHSKQANHKSDYNIRMWNVDHKCKRTDKVWAKFITWNVRTLPEQEKWTETIKKQYFYSNN